MSIAGGERAGTELGCDDVGDVAAECAEILAAAGIRPRHIDLVSPLGLAKGRRLAYRVAGEDGAVVKLRVFESDAAARENELLRDGLESAFAPVCLRSGRVLLERWIEGTPLTEAAAESRAAEAGALLGRLHTRSLPASSLPTATTEQRRHAAESDVEVLTAAGALAPAEARRLRAELAAHDPGHARCVLVHLDFCAENMVVDPAGMLHLIDNEQISIEPAGFDLGRTFQRWPMSPAVWRAFGSGYHATGAPDPGATAFWRYVAALVGARVYLQRGSARLGPVLGLLRRLLAGEALDDGAGR